MLSTLTEADLSTAARQLRPLRQVEKQHHLCRNSTFDLQNPKRYTVVLKHSTPACIVYNWVWTIRRPVYGEVFVCGRRSAKSSFVHWMFRGWRKVIFLPVISKFALSGSFINFSVCFFLQSLNKTIQQPLFFLSEASHSRKE